MDEELGQDLEVLRPTLHYLVPHVHDKQVVVVVYELLTDFVELGEELKAFVVDQIGEDEGIFFLAATRRVDIVLLLMRQVGICWDLLSLWHAWRPSQVDIA